MTYLYWVDDQWNVDRQKRAAKARSLIKSSLNQFLSASRRQERLQARDDLLEGMGRSHSQYSQEQGWRPYQDQSQTIHTFPDGWTVKRLNTKGDYYYEGTLMGHCVSQEAGGHCDGCGGTRSCEYCGGSGREECNECEGAGQRDCEDCENGQVECSANCLDGKVSCEDYGDHQDEDCPDCDDTGEIDCEDCQGHGTEECINCDGMAQVDCDGCYGEGATECGECLGSGECAYCEGQGVSTDPDWPNLYEHKDESELQNSVGAPFSLRDPDNIPHATWYDGSHTGEPGTGESIESAYGREDSLPHPKYQKRILEFAKTYFDKDESKENSVRVTFGGRGKSYTRQNIDDILANRIPKPDAMLLSYSKDRNEGLYFASAQEAVNQSYNNFFDPEKARGCPQCQGDREWGVNCPNNHTTNIKDSHKLYGVPTLSIPDSSMEYDPAKDLWEVKRGKISKIPIEETGHEIPWHLIKEAPSGGDPTQSIVHVREEYDRHQERKKLPEMVRKLLPGYSEPPYTITRFLRDDLKLDSVMDLSVDEAYSRVGRHLGLEKAPVDNSTVNLHDLQTEQATEKYAFYEPQTGSDWLWWLEQVNRSIDYDIAQQEKRATKLMATKEICPKCKGLGTINLRHVTDSDGYHWEDDPCDACDGEGLKKDG